MPLVFTDTTLLLQSNSAGAHIRIGDTDITDLSGGESTIGIGTEAGYSTQGSYAIALGNHAGANTQGDYSVAIGYLAGRFNQNQSSVAIGASAGNDRQGYSSIAIGGDAATTNQGNNAIAIGSGAGVTDQHDRTIILSASDDFLYSEGTDRFYVNPVRVLNSNAGAYALYWNPTSKEIFAYAP